VDAKHKKSVRLPARWVIFLILLSLFPVYFSVLVLLQPGDRIFAGIWGVVAALGVFVQFILLTYHIIRRKYLLYTKIYNETSTDRQEMEPDKSGRRIFSGKLTREGLEEWFRDEKPYLKADFKITDVVEEMNVNRSIVSDFINKTYGMNFNRFVNRWRLKEYERLSLLYGNEHKSVSKLYAQAGFSELRQYYRAVAAEQKANEK
jgi:AraC-like DNA-binding protein